MTLIEHGVVLVVIVVDANGMLGFVALEQIKSPRLRAVNIALIGGRPGFLIQAGTRLLAPRAARGRVPLALASVRCWG